MITAIVARAAATDWSIRQPKQIVLMALLGVCVGLAEELATRGLAVQMPRGAGHSERYVRVVSSLLFALMHVVNVLSGMKASTVPLTVVPTFGFGVCMYLTMRLTADSLEHAREGAARLVPGRPSPWTRTIAESTAKAHRSGHPRHRPGRRARRRPAPLERKEAPG